MSKKRGKKGKRRGKKKSVPFAERKIDIWQDNDGIMMINQISEDFFDVVTEFGALYLH